MGRTSAEKDTKIRELKGEVNRLETRVAKLESGAKQADRIIRRFMIENQKLKGLEPMALPAEEGVTA
ncbi:MAG: hypothetical protein JRL30_00800 [Deltaproteobacteria bacterium]|nr:hypothetical protein [Deltaproteobacteria bacterium]